MDEGQLTADPSTGATRRQMLKRIGVGAAVAWSAPAVLSMSAAHAQGTGPCPATGCAKGEICDSKAGCGIDNGDRCSCLHTTDPGSPTFCSDTDFICNNQVCTTCDDCQAGWACIDSCCPNDVCAPPCTNTLAADVQQGAGASL